MPTAPDHLRQKFEDDTAARDLLEAAGYSLTHTFDWVAPAPHTATLEELDAVEYLILEWDYGGIRDAQVGDLLRWECVPSGALVLEVRNKLFTLRIGERGYSVGMASGEHFCKFPVNTWEWKGQGGECRVLALGLTGEETAEELKALALAGLASVQ